MWFSPYLLINAPVITRNGVTLGSVLWPFLSTVLRRGCRECSPLPMSRFLPSSHSPFRIESRPSVRFQVLTCSLCALQPGQGDTFAKCSIRRLHSLVAQIDAANQACSLSRRLASVGYDSLSVSKWRSDVSTLHNPSCVVSSKKSLPWHVVNGMTSVEHCVLKLFAQCHPSLLNPQVLAKSFNALHILHCALFSTGVLGQTGRSQCGVSKMTSSVGSFAFER